jgi:hypothetical protein
MRIPSPLAGTSLILAALLCTQTGCNSGGNNETVYFSINDYQGAIYAYVSIDLSAPDQEIARNADGTFQCTIDPALAAAGCTLTLSEDESDATLLAEVEDCDLSVVASLFSCVFVKVDVSAMEFGPSDHCGAKVDEDSCYVHGICDVCASTQPGRQGCEACGNLLDDDGDGKADCDDSDCDLTEDCGFGRTTVTCDITSTTGTTTSSTTLPVAVPAPISMVPEDRQSGGSPTGL